MVLPQAPGSAKAPPPGQKFELPEYGALFATQGQEATRGLLKELPVDWMERFGEKWARIRDEYNGYVEFVRDEHDQIVDVKPPDRFLNLMREQEVQRHMSGDYSSPSMLKLLGDFLDPSSLKRLAQAKMVQLAMKAHQIRHEPSVLYDIVAEGVRHRPFLYKNGQIEEAYSRPSALAMSFRIEVHYWLNRVATWAHIVAAFEDAENLGAWWIGPDRAKRKEFYILMNAVAWHVESDLRNEADNLSTALVIDSPTSQYFGAYGEKVEGELGNFYPDMSNPVVNEKSLDGYFVRFCSPDDVSFEHMDKRRHASKSYDTTWDSFLDLCDYLPKATEVEKSRYSAQIWSRVDEVLQIKDFRDMAETLFVGPRPNDDRLQAAQAACHLAIDIMEKAPVERYLKNLDALKKPSTLNKLWRELDGISVKMARKDRFEQVYGFAQVQPRWNTSIAVDIESEDDKEDVAPPEPGPKKRRSRPPPQPPTPHKEPEPAIVKPFWVGSSKLVSSSDEPTATPNPRLGTEAKASASQVRQPILPTTANRPATSPPETTSADRLPYFHVPVRIKAIWEKLFSHGSEKGQLRFVDIEKALAALGFRKESRYGSVVRFIPPDPQAIPFICHKPHGTDPTVSPVLQRNIAGHLNALYGWTKEWFGVKRKAQ